jgi:hypothetical protein
MIGRITRRTAKPGRTRHLLGCLCILAMSGCMLFSDNVWQPSYAGATLRNNNPCGSGGAKGLDIPLRNNVELWMHPVYIDRENRIAFAVHVPAGEPVRMVSDKARIEVASEVSLVPLEYQGPPPEITATDRPNAYTLAGRDKVYVFHVRTDQIKSNEFILTIPILKDPEDLEMVRVRFDRHRAVGYVGMC